MQVASFYRDNVTLMGLATTMSTASETSFISLEETENNADELPVKEDTPTRSDIVLSVSSLVNLASMVLNGSESLVKTKEKPNQNDVVEKKIGIETHAENHNILTQENIHQAENYSKTSCNEDDKVIDKSRQTFSPLSIDTKDHSPSLESSIETKKVISSCKFTLNHSDASDHISSHETALSFKEHPNSVDSNFSISESNQIQINPNTSSIMASNIRETHGCATNISDSDKTEAENLVIHEQDHSNKMRNKSTENNIDIAQLLKPSKSEQCNNGQECVTDVQSHSEQQEQLNLQVHSREDQDESNRANSNPYSNSSDFPECLRRNVNESHHNRQTSDSQIDDIKKIENISSNINLSNQLSATQQYHHIQENQDRIRHQHSQQFFLHQDQQHLMHHPRHQQHSHHQSELIAYLHQDSTTMQHPHHIRTYQHYQQQQQRLHQLSYPQTSSPQQSHKHGPLTCIDDLMIDDFHDDPSNRYKMLSPTVKHESQDDGYETSAGDVLTPNSHSSHSMTPQHQMHSINLLRTKSENVTPSNQADQDPYNFIDEEMNPNIRMTPPSSNNGIPMTLHQQNYETSSDAVTMAVRMEDQNMIDANNALQMQSSNANEITGGIQVPKKRGRKKKSNDDVSDRPMVDGNLKPILQKERKKHDRFNGMPEEEVSRRTLPDHLANNLDIIIIGINPGLFAAYKGHHYAGPGNHFWKCLYLSGLTREQMTAEEDYKLLKIGIGFTNMVERATKGSADLTRKEIKEGSRILLEKLKRFRPKIAVFNGKLIFEVFSGKKEFNFGRQQECVEGTDTYMWVMPSSSARCAQLPRAADKVPFYTALKKFRDYLNGLIPHIDDLECVFNDPKTKSSEPEIKERTMSTCTNFLLSDCRNTEKECLPYNNGDSSPIKGNTISDLNGHQSGGNSLQKESPSQSAISSIGGSTICGIILQGLNSINNANTCNDVTHTLCNTAQPEKKKRGRPKKIKGVDGGDCSVPHKIRNTNSLTTSNNNILNLTLLGANGEIPKKKRGRPKKIKVENGGTLRSEIHSNCNVNSGQIISTNSIHNDGANASNIKNVMCVSRCSPSHIGSHQMLAMNTCNQFNTQMPQQQSLQNQRLFTSPMHSPDTASSYCSIGINVPTTPPTGSASINSTALGNSGSFHQQLGNSHTGQSHHHNHVLQHTQHQLQAVPGIYLPSPNHTPQQQPQSPHYNSSHSDLSADISAAISSDHLCESQSESSPVITAADYDRPESVPNDEHNGNLRFSSPSNGVEQSRVDRSAHQIHHYHNIYQGGNSTQSYTNTNNASMLTEVRNANTSGDIGYSVSTGGQTPNGNTSTPQPTLNTPQQQNTHISDMSSKSLSGLESLVEQIPTISENESQNQLTSIVGSVECRLKSDSDEGYPSPVSGGNDTSSISGALGCIYVPTYSNLNSSTPSPSSSAPSNSSLISPHQYPDPTYSTAITCSSTTNTNGNNINYSSLASTFSVSSLTSNDYSTNSYHPNIMAAPVVSSPHHVAAPVSGNSMYMDSHLPVTIGTLYPHPYAQQASYGAYNHAPPSSQPPTLHMPSSNFPYTYANNSSYPNQTHHSSHTNPAGYLSSHTTMFDRIKPDIGYGGY